MLCIGDVGEIKGIGGAETARKIPTPIPRRLRRGWVHFMQKYCGGKSGKLSKAGGKIESRGNRVRRVFGGSVNDNDFLALRKLDFSRIPAE